LLRLSSNEPPSCWLRLARSRAALILDSAHGATGSGNPLFNSTNMPTQVWHEWMREAIYRHWWGGQCSSRPLDPLAHWYKARRDPVRESTVLPCAVAPNPGPLRAAPARLPTSSLKSAVRSARRADAERQAPLPMVLMIRDNPTGAPMNLGAGRARRDARVVAILSSPPEL